MVSENLGGSNYTRKSTSPHDAGINYLMRVISDAAQFDICVYGPMRSAPVQLSLPRVSRIVRRYYRFGVYSGASLLDFLAEHLRITDEMRYRIIHHRDWERALMYLDPTGNAAVRGGKND